VTSLDGSPVDLSAYPAGSRLRVLPSHACMTATAYDGYHMIENGAVTGWWPRVNGW